MDFWRTHMPDGMYLRSASNWHLDPLSVDTIEACAATQGLTTNGIESISRTTYLDYTEWFQRRKNIVPLTDPIVRLYLMPDGKFQAALASADTIEARRVLLALGFGAFQHVPAELSTLAVGTPAA